MCLVTVVFGLTKLSLSYVSLKSVVTGFNGPTFRRFGKTCDPPRKGAELVV